MERWSRPEEYETMSPQARHAEFRKFYTLLPAFSTLYPNARDILDLASQETIHTDQNTLDHREDSQLKPILTEQMRLLLIYSYLTASAQKYLILDFRDLFYMGIDPEEISQLSPSGDILEARYKWQDTEGAGIFDPEEALGMESRLYREAVKTQLMKRRIDEEFEQNPPSAEFIDFIRENVSSARILRQTLSDEELIELEAQEQKENEYVHQIMQEEKYLEELVRQWRADYIEKYHSEP